jgi:TRAP-type C4-dicarboxylate transport system substrate-binding protein
MKPTRRNVLAAGAALPLFGILTHRADAAQFSYKLATGQAPTHPVNVQAKAAADRIREATSGQLDISVFPAAQLGTDAQLISQVRLGAVQFINMASTILATTVPAAGIVNVGFAFDSYAQVWQAMDGAVGAYIKGKIADAGMMAIGPSWNNGFRQLTTSTKPVHHPGDLVNLKI